MYSVTINAPLGGLPTFTFTLRTMRLARMFIAAMNARNLPCDEPVAVILPMTLAESVALVDKLLEPD